MAWWHAACEHGGFVDILEGGIMKAISTCTLMFALGVAGTASAQSSTSSGPGETGDRSRAYGTDSPVAPHTAPGAGSGATVDCPPPAATGSAASAAAMSTRSAQNSTSSGNSRSAGTDCGPASSGGASNTPSTGASSGTGVSATPTSPGTGTLGSGSGASPSGPGLGGPTNGIGR